MNNKIIDINNEYVTIQVSNGNELFIIDRFIYDNYWDDELSTHIWYRSENEIRGVYNNKHINLSYIISIISKINQNNKHVTLRSKSKNGIYDLRLINLKVHECTFEIIDEYTSICHCNFDYDISFLFDTDIFNIISKYNWRAKINKKDNCIRIRASVENNQVSLLKVILCAKGIDSDIKSIKMKNKYALNNNIIDFRINNFTIKNEVISLNNNYAFIKATSNNNIFIIDRFIYDKYWDDIISNYLWYCCGPRIYTNNCMHNAKYIHRFILYLLNINIDNYHIHHINFNPLDNSINNLFICSENLHHQIHGYISYGNYIELKSNVIECINNNGVVPDKYSLSLNDILYNYNTVKPKIMKPFIFYN